MSYGYVPTPQVSCGKKVRTRTTGNITLTDFLSKESLRNLVYDGVYEDSVKGETTEGSSIEFIDYRFIDYHSKWKYSSQNQLRDFNSSRVVNN